VAHQQNSSGTAGVPHSAHAKWLQQFTILFRPYRARNAFSVHDATNLLPLRGIDVLPFYLDIGYWLFIIEPKDKPTPHFLIRCSLFKKKQNLSPDRPYALCPMPYAKAQSGPASVAHPQNSSTTAGVPHSRHSLQTIALPLALPLQMHSIWRDLRCAPTCSMLSALCSLLNVVYL